MSDVFFLDSLELEEEATNKNNDLKKLSDLITVLNAKRKEINLIDDQLKILRKEEKVISEVEIPEYMASRNWESITTKEGFKVTVKESLKAYLPKEPLNRSTALRWIIKNKGASIIKNKLEIEDPEVNVVNFLTVNNVPFKKIQDIHNSTLVSFMKGLLGISKGSLQTVELSEVPEELGAYMFNKTTIKG